MRFAASGPRLPRCSRRLVTTPRPAAVAIASCPGDTKSTAVRRAAVSACDSAESCNGASNNCLANVVAPAGTAVRVEPCARVTSCDSAAKVLCQGHRAKCWCRVRGRVQQLHARGCLQWRLRAYIRLRDRNPCSCYPCSVLRGARPRVPVRSLTTPDSICYANAAWGACANNARPARGAEHFDPAGLALAGCNLGKLFKSQGAACLADSNCPGEQVCCSGKCSTDCDIPGSLAVSATLATDYVPGYEFDTVTLQLDNQSRQLAVTPVTELVNPRPIGQFVDVRSGRHIATLSLTLQGTVAASRTISFSTDADVTVPYVLTRDCTTSNCGGSGA